MRLDKYLTMAGFGSRKEVKKAIRSKKVKVNDQIIIADDYHINPATDLIFYEQWQVDLLLEVYIMLNKPKGVVSATTDSLHETVLDCIDISLPSDVFPIGRLDIDTEGLLLLTNDGPLGHRLTSPKHHVEKEYLVICQYDITADMVEQLTKGVDIGDDTFTKPARVNLIDNKTMSLTITEGRFHQIKRMLVTCGNEVSYLKRLRMGPISLDDNLDSGEWRLLSAQEIEVLKKI